MKSLRRRVWLSESKFQLKKKLMTGDKETKFEHKFEYQWGGKDTWYTKGKRWAKKQKFPMDYLALSVIEWAWLWWTDAKTKAEMAKVDVQAEEIKQEWPRMIPNLL